MNRKIGTLRLMCMMTATAIGMCAFPIPSAWAETFGEIRQVGQAGTGSGEFKIPSDLAVNPTDNSVYVLDAPKGTANPGTQSEYRIQEFAATLGSPVASVVVQTPKTAEGEQFVAGMAIDAALERVYVLKATKSKVTGYPNVANEIIAYSTKAEMVGGNSVLPLASGLTNGVLYKFTSPPPSSDTVRNPMGMAVDPKSHDLLVLGTDSSKNTVIARIGSSGQLGKVYNDGATHQFGPEGDNPRGLSVGPDGSIYLVVRYNTTTQTGESPGVVKMTEDFSKVSVVHQGNELPELTGGSQGGSGVEYGPQISVDPTGKSVYAMEVTQSAVAETAGSYELRGMSTATGVQQAVYGGGSSTCVIASQRSAIAAGSGGIVYVLDEGRVFNNLPSSYGYHLIEFGPGGSGCPAPVTSIKVNSDTSSPTVTVQKGEEVSFEASATELNNEEPTELVWEGEGPEKYKTEISGKPASLKTARKFLKPGLYTVTLNMKVSPGTLGPPPATSRKVEVVAPPPTAHFEASQSEPAPGETVTFNASESSDPTGSPQGGPTKHLKSYTWNFGDGSAPVSTKSPEITHAFANSGSQPVHDTVTLTVTNEEEVQSEPTQQTLTVKGTPVPPQKQPEGPPLVTPIVDRTPTELSPGVSAGSGAVDLKLSCPATKVSCGATVKVKATPKAKSSSRKRKGKPSVVTIGQGSFSLVSGQHETVVVRLSSSGLALLKKEKTLKVQVIVSAHDSYGDPKTETLTVTLHAPKTHGKSKHG